MTWLTVIASLLALLTLTALVSWLVLYIQFCHSVEKRWASQVLALRSDAEHCARSENQELRRLKTKRDAEARSFHEDAFHGYLRNISVNDLEAYPGIGPGTVGKLRVAGFVSLATLRNAHIRIHGLGEKRLADIDYAVRDLLRKARSTFDAGGCPQAQSLADQLEALSARYDRLEVRARTRARAAEEFIDRLEERVGHARAVTFWRWFRPISNEVLLPPEVMDVPLPDLDAVLQAAEGRAARSGATKHRQAPANPVPAIPISVKGRPVPHAQAPRHAPAVALNAEPAMPDETHLLLMELTIQFALAVARADGPVTWTERELIQQHLRHRFSYNRALLNRAEAFCAHYETAPIDLERCVAQINERFTTGHRAALMAFAGQIVAVSGNEAKSAASFLLGLAQRLGVPPVALPQPAQPAQPLVPPTPPSSPPPAVKPAVPPRPPVVRVAAAAPPAAPAASARPPVATSPPSLSFQLWKDQPAVPARPPVATSPAPARPAPPPPKPAVPTRDECLALLEIPPSAPLSADLVRRQWNLLSERLAPEKVASMGPEFVKLAETKLAALRRAAEILLETMGEKLESEPPTPPARDLRHNPDLDDVFGGM